MTRFELISAMGVAMARQEGFYVIKDSIWVVNPTSRAARNNNPGNLRPFKESQLRDDPDFKKAYRKFLTVDDGRAALHSQIDLNIGRHLTFLEFFAGKPGVYAGYAPGADSNHPLNYAKFVINQVKKIITPDPFIPVMPQDDPDYPLHTKIESFVT